MLTAKEQEILDALEPKAMAEDVEIVTVEITGAKRAPTIRVYIDTENGVGFDELSSAQQWVSDILDALDPFPGAYQMEVSSPGIDRLLRTKEHFERFAGERVTVKAVRPVDGRSAWTGTLRGMEGDDVIVETDENRFAIPYESIKRAQVKGVIDFKK